MICRENKRVKELSNVWKNGKEAKIHIIDIAVGESQNNF